MIRFIHWTGMYPKFGHHIVSPYVSPNIWKNWVLHGKSILNKCYANSLPFIVPIIRFTSKEMIDQIVYFCWDWTIVGYNFLFISFCTKTFLRFCINKFETSHGIGHIWQYSIKVLAENVFKFRNLKALSVSQIWIPYVFINLNKGLAP